MQEQLVSLVGLLVSVLILWYLIHREVARGVDQVEKTAREVAESAKARMTREIDAALAEARQLQSQLDRELREAEAQRRRFAQGAEIMKKALDVLNASS